ncbi:hypothetical protein I6F48_18175 [Pseudoalteromonas sp. SWYJ118]|uniref:hypothetical protein n=1 Tax=Pseudoalteromonas sp. SWYJ118 TaxID=2792062 RepID=UPI0018CD166F|nr:hypothetical protein [Pseudoalteromonas sp. SWYJ118]MBH0077452.1 hypothetical protein [Pseudoalteromonas sp. SWYJ118]
MAEKMVLNTSLLIAYENMAFEPRKYQKKYKRLMKLISLPYKTNKKQLIRAKADGLNQTVYDRLMPQLQNEPDRDDSLEVLASKTSLKVILTEDEEAILPYVYYRSSFISNQITISLKASENRGDLVRYLQMLCFSATRVTICDNYLAQGWDNTQSLFRAVFPRNKLDIQFVETPNTLAVIKNSTKVTDGFAKSICIDWVVSESTLYQSSHDRYLLIEAPQGNIEVMISSGFDHIWKTNPKEITCVIREK